MSRSGYVALIGRPNVGKSTLLNRLVGEKVAIVSDKPQTTRHRTLGVRNIGDTQLVFVDTPGIHRPGYRLNERMMEEVYQSVKEVDLLIQVVDASERFGKGDRYVLDLVRATAKPTLLVLNKVDVINKGKLLPMLQFYGGEYEYLEMIPVSAVEGDNLEVLEEKIVQQLAQQDWIFPSEYLTNQTERMTISEIIREKVLQHTRQELPYSTAVQVEEVEESRRPQGFLRITASIIVDKPSQKKIVIGRGGRLIKVIGSQARKELQELLEVRTIYLDLNVKVVSGWRNQEHLLDELARSG